MWDFFFFFFFFWGTKTRLWVHYKVKINSSSQNIRLRYKGWEGGGGPYMLTPRGRVWEGHPPPMVGTFTKFLYKIQVVRALA